MHISRLLGRSLHHDPRTFSEHLSQDVEDRSRFRVAPCSVTSLPAKGAAVDPDHGNNGPCCEDQYFFCLGQLRGMNCAKLEAREESILRSSKRRRTVVRGVGASASDKQM